MISTLLGRIANVFDKAFLFASFLPCLIFSSALAGSLVSILGWEASVTWMEAQGAARLTMLLSIAGAGIAAFAYVMSGLRLAFTQLWSGHWPKLLWGFNEVGKAVHMLRYARLQKRARRLSPWGGILATHQERLRAVWNTSAVEPTAEALKALTRLASGLRNRMSDSEIERRLGLIVAGAQAYSGNSMSAIHQILKAKLVEWDDLERTTIQNDTAQLDRRYGSLASIRATSLGNVVEAYGRYAFTRYGIETEVFWPGLQQHMSASFRDLVSDQRTLLDFYLASATLTAMCAVLALSVGPWIAPPAPCEVFAIATAIMSYIFYRLAVLAALQFGDLLRSGFDLFRLDLLLALGRPRPASLVAERQSWSELSELAAYGTVHDFVIAPVPAPALEPPK